MANESQQQTQTEKSLATPSIGGRLKSVREELGQTRKDIAAQLRLSEAVIAMMEENKFASDLPTAFIRGYIRAYGKLVGIPEADIQEAIEPFKPTTEPVEQDTSTKPSAPVTSSNYFMQFSTYIIVLTITGLVGTWWYNHNSNTSSAVIADNTQSNTQTKAIALPAITETVAQNQPQTAAPAQVQNQIQTETQGQTPPPPEPLAPALGAAIVQSNTASTVKAANELPNQQQAAEPKKVQAAKKPAYLRHDEYDDDDDL